MAEEYLHFRDKAEWHDWLEKNHGASPGVQMVYYKKATGQAGVSYEEALEEALCFGWIDDKLHKIDEEKYARRFSPRNAKSIWSMTNRKKAEQLIEQGRMTEAGMAKIEQARQNGAWESAYPPREEQAMPDDLENALAADTEARANFHAFAKSYRRNYIGWLNSAKTEPTRLKRIGIIVERAKRNEKPGMM